MITCKMIYRDVVNEIGFDLKIKSRKPMYTEARELYVGLCSNYAKDYTEGYCAFLIGRHRTIVYNCIKNYDNEFKISRYHNVRRKLSQEYSNDKEHLLKKEIYYTEKLKQVIKRLELLEN